VHDQGSFDQALQWVHSYGIAVIVSQFAANWLRTAIVKK
jgi:hypothetical protein